jgi:hypothetical protein
LVVDGRSRVFLTMKWSHKIALGYSVRPFHGQELPSALKLSIRTGLARFLVKPLVESFHLFHRAGRKQVIDGHVGRDMPKKPG